MLVISLMKLDLYIGIAAIIITTGSFLPQVIKAHKTKHTADLSLPMYLLFSTGVGLWVIYGVLTHAWPIIIANATILVLSSYILFLKIKHG